MAKILAGFFLKALLKYAKLDQDIFKKNANLIRRKLAEIDQK
jgi:hypothetical protein